MINSYIRRAVQDILKELLPLAVSKQMERLLPGMLRKLSPDKYYLLVLPEDVPEGDLLGPIAEWAGQQRNLLVLQANGVKLLEFGGKSGR